MEILCRCSRKMAGIEVLCSRPATEEDGLCDFCRERGPACQDWEDVELTSDGRPIPDWLF